MDQKFFDVVLENRIDLIKKVLSSKAKEYAGNRQVDRMHNFNRAAAMLNTTSERALVGMMAKHWVSVLDLVDNGAFNLSVPLSVPFVEEKIGDSINSLILLEAILKEKISAVIQSDYNNK